MRQVSPWLQLAWNTTQPITRIELTFPGQVLTEPHSEHGFFVARQVAQDYTIEVDAGDDVWREVARVEGNWAWRRVHDLPVAVAAHRLRVVIAATNGDPAAAIGEVRWN